MKKYIVTEELLRLAQRFFNENPHAEGCALNDFWGDIDHCTCRNSEIRREYIAECGNIVEVKE